MTDDDSSTINAWEKKFIKDIVFANLKEQKSKRRWKIFFRLIILAYIIAITAYYFMQPSPFSAAMVETHTPHIGIVKVFGTIAEGQDANADNVINALQQAFKNNLTQGIVLRINSPGGSSVQSRMIYDEIKHLREKYDKPVIAAIEDSGTSAAYLVAAAADQIFADETSIVGSIGVLVNSFGFVELIEKLGITRRLYTAGKHKGMLDPFSPVEKDEKAILDTELSIFHQQFIDNVKQGRGDKLSLDPDLFSGRFWSGYEAKKLGLIDEFGNYRKIARNIFQQETMVDYSHKKGFKELFKSFSSMSATLRQVIQNWFS